MTKAIKHTLELTRMFLFIAYDKSVHAYYILRIQKFWHMPEYKNGYHYLIGWDKN